MLKFLVWHVLFVAVTCELFAEESGYVVEYAPAYHNYKPRDYHFNYAVSDPHTGDHKSQWEVKTNGVVRGGYSLLEPDGTTRLVEYIADDHGFRAVVNKLGTAVHPAVVPQVPVVAQPVPQVVQPLPEVSHYAAYDGRVNNYAPRVEVPQVPVVARPVQPLPQVSHYAAYDGRVNNYAPQVEVPSVGVQVPPILYRIEQNLGGSDGLVTQPQALGIIDTSRELNAAVPLVQSQEVGPVPLQINQQYAGGIVPEHQIVQVPAQGHDVHNLEGVPLLQTTNIGGADGVQQAYNLGRVDAVPLQGYDLGRVEGVAHDVGRAEVVPAIQDQNLGRIQVGLDRAAIQGYDLGQVGGDFGAGQAVRVYQGHDTGRIDGDLRVPIEANNHLPQPQIEIYNPRPIPQLQEEGAAVPGVVPVDPSYTTNIEYQGLVNDNQLKKDVYHASYSERVLKVVPSPRKHDKKAKKDFLIYYPDSESH
ncbi:uncharacterized protein LOC135124870 [Zophobas morio]|uniref:uncharacterized protein LOC135124870 n=1 Tax=Zophobas morio TaxID=2755281 RepID=UPI003082EBE1